MREKYCWLAGGCWLVLVWCKKKTLLAGCSEQSEIFASTRTYNEAMVRHVMMFSGF